MNKKNRLVYADFATKTQKDLYELMGSCKKELLNIRILRATSQEAGSVTKIRQLRRDVARIQTALTALRKKHSGGV